MGKGGGGDGIARRGRMSEKARWGLRIKRLWEGMVQERKGNGRVGVK